MAASTMDSFKGSAAGLDSASSDNQSDLDTGMESMVLASLGSAAHRDAACRPCVFVRCRLGCPQGVLCGFCHEEHMRKKGRAWATSGAGACFLQLPRNPIKVGHVFECPRGRDQRPSNAECAILPEELRLLISCGPCCERRPVRTLPPCERGWPP